MDGPYVHLVEIKIAQHTPGKQSALLRLAEINRAFLKDSKGSIRVAIYSLSVLFVSLHCHGGHKNLMLRPATVKVKAANSFCSLCSNWHPPTPTSKSLSTHPHHHPTTKLDLIIKQGPFEGLTAVWMGCALFL